MKLLFNNYLFGARFEIFKYLLQGINTFLYQAIEMWGKKRLNLIIFHFSFVGWTFGLDVKLCDRNYVWEFCDVNSVHWGMEKGRGEKGNFVEVGDGSVKEFNIFFTSAAFSSHCLSIPSFVNGLLCFFHKYPLFKILKLHKG